MEKSRRSSPLAPLSPLPPVDVGLDDPPFEPPTAAPRRFPPLFVVGAPVLAVLVALALSQWTPAFYVQRSCPVEDAECIQLSNQFLNIVSRLIGDIQNSRDWSAMFNENQINAWLAHDFQQNHAGKSLPSGVEQPRVEISGDQLNLGFRWRRGPISTVVQIGVRAWVPKRNLLCVELKSVHAGRLPLPTTYTRKVVEDFVQAQNLDISWKRNGRRLVAVIDFDRSKRQIVLRQVKIDGDAVSVEGLGGRHAIPSTDYAPTAN